MESCGAVWSVIGIVVLLIGCGVYFDIQQDKRNEAYKEASKKAAEEEFEAEKLKPKFLVKFVDLEGNTYKTAPFEPTKYYMGFGHYNIQPSLKRAERSIELSYRDRFFKDIEGITIPAERIMSAVPEEMK